MVEKDFIYYNIIAIKWGESTHFPGRNDPGRIGNRGETTRIHYPCMFVTVNAEILSVFTPAYLCISMLLVFFFIDFNPLFIWMHFDITNQR